MSKSFTMKDIPMALKRGKHAHSHEAHYQILFTHPINNVEKPDLLKINMFIIPRIQPSYFGELTLFLENDNVYREDTHTVLLAKSLSTEN